MSHIAADHSVSEITQLVVRERQSRVRHLEEELLACFFPDATVTTSWISGSAREFAEGGHSAPGSRTAVLNRLGPPVVHPKGDRAVVELPSTTTYWLHVHGAEAVLESYMRLLYRVERREGVWKIVNLSAVNEGDTLAPAIAGTDLGVRPEDLEGLRPSYRYLAYTRLLEGITVGGDLFGIDRPEEVDRLYADAFAWRDEK